MVKMKSGDILSMDWDSDTCKSCPTHCKNVTSTYKDKAGQDITKMYALCEKDECQDLSDGACDLKVVSYLLRSI